jgi:hypothetical protein
MDILQIKCIHEMDIYKMVAWDINIMNDDNKTVNIWKKEMVLLRVNMMKLRITLVTMKLTVSG